MRISFRKFHILILTSILLLAACAPARRIEQGDYLLYSSKIKIDSKGSIKTDLKKYQKQTPNRTILGFKFHLFLYNIASPKKDKFFNKWLKEIGEEPIILDPLLIEKTTEQFKKYLETKGYYNAVVNDTIKFRKKKAKVFYSIELNNPFLIQSVSYNFEDQGIAPIIKKDSANCLIKPNDPFDMEIIQKERQRLEDLLKNHGYYKFFKEFIYFEANNADKKNYVDLNILIKENIQGELDPLTKVRKHYQYKILNSFLYPDFTLFGSAQNTGNIETDTIRYNNNTLVYTGEHKIRPVTLVAPNLLMPENLYHLNDIKQTYGNYSSLGLFKIIDIYFKDLPLNAASDTSGFKYIDCFIELTPRKVQTYHFEVIGSYSARDLGIQNSIIYNNYNLFRGAENLQIKITGEIESVKNRYEIEDGKSPLMIRSGIETSLSFPVFVVPFNAKRFIKKFNPKTIINVSYNYQFQPRFIKNIASTSFGYQWKGNSFNKHLLLPIKFDFVKLPQGSIDSVFWNEEIKQTRLESSYTNHTILYSAYQFEFSNQVIEKLKDFIFFRLNFESAGLLINAISQVTPSDNDSTFLKVPYFQYFKTDLDLRYFNQLNIHNRMAYRLFAGVGLPYGNSDVMPFEKMYSGGGPNSIRAWPTLNLGPGSDTTTYSNFNRLGDLKLEANIEYRYDLFWKLEGALFFDIGNIWTVKESPDRPGSSFQWNQFIDDLAVGSGFGLRFDLSFLLFRIDFGYKLRDPKIYDGSKWIDFNKQVHYNFIKERWTVQFGLGYSI